MGNNIDEEKCMEKVLESTKRRMIAAVERLRYVDIGNSNLIEDLDDDERRKHDFIKENYGSIVREICRTGKGKDFSISMNKAIDKVTDEAKRLNRGLTREELDKIYDDVLERDEQLKPLDEQLKLSKEE